MNRALRRGLLGALGAVLLALPIASTATVASAACEPPAFCPPEVVPFNGPNGGPRQPPVNSQPVNSQPVSPQLPREQPASSAPMGVSVTPAAAAPGDLIAISGRGFADNGRGGLVFANLITPDGRFWDLHVKEITCVETSDLYLALLQNLGWGCSSDQIGPPDMSHNDGTFRTILPVPAETVLGQGQICVSSIFGRDVCTPITITGGVPGDGQSDPGVASD